jgi:hypothetical protein
MVRFILIFSISFSFTMGLSAQKVHRAAKAMDEYKFDKSIDLFSDVLKKDSNNVSALIGFSKAHLTEHDVNKTPKDQELLENCYNYLTRAKIEYGYIKDEEAKFLINELRIFEESSIDSLKSHISNLIWKDFIKNETSISKFERFKDYFYFDNTNETPSFTVSGKLDKLYYDSAAKENSVKAYDFYLKKYPAGIYLSDAKVNIIILEYNAAMATTGIEKLIIFSKQYPNNKYTSLAKKEIEKREYERAFNNPGVELLEKFISTYPKADQIAKAKSEIELRDYKAAKSSQGVVEYETFLQKHDTSKYVNEIEDSVASMLFRTTIISNNRKELVGYVNRVKKFHEENDIKNLIDSTNRKIYNLDFAEANASFDLNTLISFYRNYKNTNYTNVSIIKKKLFTAWEQYIISNSSAPQESNGIVHFINEFNNEPESVFAKVIEATKGALLKYIDERKSSLVEDILLESQFSNFYKNLSEEQLESLTSLLAGKITIKNQTTNNDIINSIKNVNPETNFSITDIIEIFFKNISASNAFVESAIENSNQILSISYQTKTKLVSKLIVWDYNSNSFKENDDLNTNNSICSAIMQRYGITSFTIPYLTYMYNNNEYQARFYGYTNTDMICCPRYVIDFKYSIQGSKIVPMGVLTNGIQYSSGTVNPTPQKSNYVNIGMKINANSLSNL